MLYVFKNHKYELSSNQLWVDGKLCRSKVALYLTSISLLHQANYSFDLEHPCPITLRNYKDCSVKELFRFVSNLIITLCGCGQAGLEWLQACRLTSAGRFETMLDSRKVYAYELYNRFRKLIETGSSYQLDFLSRLVHDGDYLIVR